MTTSSAPDSRREQVEFYLLDHETPAGKAVDVGLLVLNLLFVLVLVVDTYPLAPRTEMALLRFEVLVSVVLAAEYVLRIYSASDRVAELFDPYTVIDGVSILPALAVLLVPGLGVGALEVGLLRALRVARVLRFYRFTDDEVFFFGRIEEETLRGLRLLLTVLTIFFISAGLFYAAEHGPNPVVETFGDAFYYVVVTLTTVGFGDIVPVTPLGRWVTVTSILAGVLVVPWQAGRIVREWTTAQKEDVTCPQCGLSYHDPDASHCKACGHVIYQEYDSR
ncbi:ion transporter [Halosegnis rubeus]|jgi:voltage-gated potassium channel|uniref:Ion transporter n=1 Tax=Halosegnis rubeus TaxID=2212850 RepID=A0A5N5UPI2_9EURY|nr:ion transporter [Halosegnis rubeus]KAB7519714.1 ion transporter [Halosegnis rubeus]